MKKQSQQLLSILQKVQKEQFEIFDIGDTKTITEVEIAELSRPDFHKRQLVESRVSSIVKSLSTYGFIGGIVINGSNKEVLDGWHRTEFWRELGNEFIPAIQIYPPNQTVAKEIHLRLNQTHAGFDLSEFDLHFPGFDPSDFGLTEDEIIQAGQIAKRHEDNRSNLTEPNHGVRFAAVIPSRDALLLKQLKNRWHLPTMGHVISKLLNQMPVQL
ncbi:hypothetical protein [Mucilaginibacter sp. KACC 22063]|uniref:hypothetical protein n=1 Tax=Mucilaginibacter sp. KACC 22063 TaxID=3025666 RepID=UPI0023660924|nr:hypothetical protein [Mucilaginibacter sp. KACC 22063]WDF55261.1 hypothetical protein PQ461_20215 [Mucilaginibacter sp. KACC 22063]